MIKLDWIDIVVAVGVIAAVATAVFTAMVAFTSRRQARLLLPVARWSVERRGEYLALYASIDKTDRERHFIAKIKRLRPWRARLMPTHFAQDALGQPVPVPSLERYRSLSFDGSAVQPPIAYIDPAGSSSIKLRFHIALRADSSAVRRFTTRIKIQD
jgi:hypothetical protein